MTWHAHTTSRQSQPLSEAASLLSAERAGVRFPPELEAAFLEEESERAGVIAGKAARLIAPIWTVMVVLDLVTLSADAIRFGSPLQVVGFAAIPVLWWCARRPRGRALRVLPLVLLAVGLSVLGKLLAVTAVGGVVRYDGLLLYVVACYVFSGLPKRRAMFVGGTLWLLYLAALPFFELQREMMTSIFLLIGNAMGAGASGIQERARRIGFLQRRVLAEERDELKELGMRLRELAERDMLTGLANRRTLVREGGRALRSARRFDQLVVVAMVDIDRFKDYNDSLGHPAGDEALVRVAEALSGLARRPLDVVARYGGEEFTVVRVGQPPSAACTLGEQVVESVRAIGLPHPSGGAVTVSTGVAIVGPEETLEHALARADVLLYQAKSGGRDRFVADGESQLAGVG